MLYFCGMQISKQVNALVTELCTCLYNGKLEIGFI